MVETLMRSLLAVEVTVGGQAGLAVDTLCHHRPLRPLAIPVGGGTPHFPQRDPTRPPESSPHDLKIIPLFSHPQIEIVQNDRTDIERRGDDGKQLPDSII